VKIIRPMDLTADGIVTSNAPTEQNPVWAPTGPDYAESLSGPLVAASSGFIYIMKSSSGPFDLRRHDPITGETTGVNLSWQQPETVTPVFIAVARDDSHIAVAFSVPGGNYVVELYEVSTGLRKFTDHCLWYRWTRVVFSSDSSALVLPTVRKNNEVKESRITIVNLVNYGRSDGDWLSHEDSNAGIHAICGLCYDNATGKAFAYLNAVTSTGGVTTGYLMSFDGTTTSQVRDSFGDLDGAALIYDPVANEVGVIKSSNIEWRNPTTLAAATTLPLPSSTRAFCESDDGSGIYFGFWVQPYVRKLNLTTRTIESTSNTLSPEFYENYGTDKYQAIAASANHLGIRQAQGFVVADLPDLTIITQTNPSVTAGDVYLYGDHRYEALTNNNDRPDVGALADPPTWLDLGFINPLRMFDNKLDSLTTGPSPLVINITPGMLVNGIALFNVNASTVQITYTDPTDGLVYDTGAISMLDNSGVQDWYSFFFDPYLVKADLARVDLPAYIDGTVQITLDGAGADVAIGEVVLGTIYKIGDAQYGSSAGIIDFSRKEADQFGNFEIVPRRFSKRAEFDAVIPPAYGGSVQRTLARLRATPVVWIGSVDLEETIVYGYFREFDILLSNPAFSNVTITVEGL
jgi:hypothetical protein